MEDAMPNVPAGPGSPRARRFLSRLIDWWRRREELDAMGPEEIQRLAGDLGMTGPELRSLAARGADAADLLHERMRALGLTRADIERAAPGLMRDLERACAGCGHKGVCENGLALRPGAGDWVRYCPNAATLTGVAIDREQPAS
jgi:hypothetical protein